MRGKSKDDPHFRTEAEKKDHKDSPTATPTVQVDYMFVKEEKGKEDKLTFFTGYIPRTGRGFVTQVFSKGTADQCPQRVLKGFLQENGLGAGATLRLDPEGAVATVVEQLIKENKGFIPERTPRKSSQSLGGCERWHQSVQGQLRTLKLQHEKNYARQRTTKDKGVPWAAQHAGWLVERFQRRANGCTAFENQKGYPYEGEVMEFSECVMWREPGENREKLRSPWKISVWLGRAADSNEHLVGTTEGVERVKTIKRFPEGRRYQQPVWDSFI